MNAKKAKQLRRTVRAALADGQLTPGAEYYDDLRGDFQLRRRPVTLKKSSAKGAYRDLKRNSA